MSVDKPPAPGALDDSTRQLQQWAQHVPERLTIEAGYISEWISGISTLMDTVNTQAANARGLRINEGAVGRFDSAIATARALNNSGDAIRERLTEFQHFADALKQFAVAAHRAQVATDGQ